MLYRYLLSVIGGEAGGAGRVCSLTVVATYYHIHTARYPGSFDLTHHHHCSIFFYVRRGLMSKDPEKTQAGAHHIMYRGYDFSCTGQ